MIMSLGAVCLRGMSGGGRDFPQRKWLGMFHGIGSLLALISGFAMVAKKHLEWQGWLVALIGIWLLLSVAPALIYRKPAWAKLLWLSIAGLSFLASWLAGAKPF